MKALVGKTKHIQTKKLTNNNALLKGPVAIEGKRGRGRYNYRQDF